MKITMTRICGIILLALGLSTMGCKTTEHTDTEHAKECADLTKDGEPKCTAKDAVKGKICVWKDDACAEKPSIGKCEDITKDKASCEKADAVAGKACLWMAGKCKEKSAELSQFMSQDMNFESKITNDQMGPGVWGAGHGETPDWNRICTIAGLGGTLHGLVGELALHFKKDTDSVQLVLDCTKGTGGAITYDLLYSAETLANNALLITLDLNGKSVMGKSGDPKKDQNQLEFFTKTKWFYSPASNEIKGAGLLANIGHNNYKIIDFKTEQEMDDAITYVKDSTKGNGWEVGPNVGAITFVFKKI